MDPRAVLERTRAKLGEMRAAKGTEPVPMRFTEFCAWIDVALEPGQRVISLVAYEGVDPVDLPPAERKIARTVFGDVERFSPAERDVIVLVCGARAGKTYVLVALRVLHLALTVALTTLAPGEVASAPIIAPDKDLAGQALRYIQGACAHPKLRDRVNGKPDAAESIDIKREGGRLVEIVVRAASARGRTGRGRSLVCAALDEAAFFYDASYRVNDEEIYRGLSPRILPGGQLIIDSTPWAQAGLLFELFSANHPNPETAGLPPRPVRARTAMAIHAPTLRLRDTVQMQAMVSREEARDPDNAAREYGARFMVSGAQTFFEPACIEACLDLDLVLPLPPRQGVEVVAGGDMGFTKNSSALCIGQVERLPPLLAPITRVAEFVERKPKPGEPLRPGEVSKEFLDRIVAHGGTGLMADQHYRETVWEHASPRGLAVFPAPTIPADEFIAVRARMREARYRFPNHPRFLKQLRETMGIPGSGGRMTIRLPKWATGEHGDLVVAFVHMAFQTCGTPIPGPAATPEQLIERETAEHWQREQDEINGRTRDTWERDE